MILYTIFTALAVLVMFVISTFRENGISPLIFLSMWVVFDFVFVLSGLIISYVGYLFTHSFSLQLLGCGVVFGNIVMFIIALIYLKAV